MSTPLFANNWYGQLPVDEVRKEVQNLYANLGGGGSPAIDAYTKAEVDALLLGKSDVGHTHVTADITDLASYTGLDARYYTESEVNTLLAGKADTSHTHTTSDITNLSSYTGFDARYYTESEVDALLTGLWALMPDGTAGTPGLRFSADPNTGIFRPTTDQLAISAGGTQRVVVTTGSVSSIEPFQGGFESAGSPTFSFSSDTNTGMYRADTDVLGFATGGSERLRVGANGISFDGGTRWLGTLAQGSFTPVYQPSGGSVTMASNVGRYRRVGDLVYVELRVATDALSSPTGEVFIGGLPFTSRADDGSGLNRYSLSVGAAWSFATAGLILRAHVLPSESRIRVVGNASSSGFGTLQGSNLASGTGRNNLFISGVYPI